MIYGYARCSTNEEKQDIERQVRYLVSKGIKRENIYYEYISGASFDKVELNKLLNIIKENDTIVTTEVSRLARSMKHFMEIISLIEKKHIRLEVGTLIFDCRKGQNTDIMTKAMLQIMGVFSELERNMISQRVKSGIKNAKAKGKIIGRPSVTIDDIPQKYLDTRQLVLDKKIKVTDACKILGISRKTYYKYKKILEKCV